jgi:arylsulfatase A-like enzyme/Tfp pilus assembly protein PilF
VALLALGAVAAWFLHASRETPGGVPPAAARSNVLIVSIDTLRADRTGGPLTPELNALAARGVRFLNARSPVPLTLPAHASLMTGLLPPRHGVRMNGVHRLSPGVPTLATTLQGAGYQTGAIVGAYVLDRRFGLARGFDSYDAEIARRAEIAGELEAERRGEIVADRAIAWLKARRPDAPFFLWMHLYDPHAPYAPPGAWVEQAGGQPYDGEVAYADAQLGRVLDALQAGGQADRTLVIVTGDHGESLGEHGEPTHGLLVYEGAVRIPLVIAGPGVPRAERADAASLVDVLPTVLRLLGFQPAAGVTGRDLLAPKAEATEAEVYLETEYPDAAGFASLRALVDGRWKYVGGAEPAELYDLAADAGEQSDVSGSHRGVVDAMARRVREMTAGAAPSTAVAPSPEVTERLRALGYVASAPGGASGAAPRPSPRLLVTVWPAFQAALGDMAAKRIDRAVPALAALARDFPDSLLFQSSYGRALDEAGRSADALTVYRRAVARWPQNTSLLQGLATAARSAGLPDEALKAEQAVLAIDPTDAAAENGIGLLHADRGRAEAARDAFRRAIALDPNVVSYWVNLGNACRSAGQAREADEAYRRALTLDEASVDAMNGIGVLLVQAGRAGEASGWFERAVGVSPEFYEAWLNLGIARQEQGDRDAAAAAYRRVLSAPTRFARERDAARQLLASLPR